MREQSEVYSERPSLSLMWASILFYFTLGQISDIVIFLFTDISDTNSGCEVTTSRVKNDTGPAHCSSMDTADQHTVLLIGRLYRETAITADVWMFLFSQNKLINKNS